MRGDRVVVRDYKGEAVACRVWDEIGETIVVTNDAGFARLEAGYDDAPTVGFPRVDVIQNNGRPIGDKFILA